MSRRLKPTLADYVVIAVNPVLIMGLVGSLIYFLLEILYRGQYPDRLQFCLSCFVFAIVLVSRISMEDGFERAAPFGIALAVVVGIALNRFVVYQSPAAASFGWLINWSLMALTWWCAHKLTWDCTTIDDGQEASGRGLLETAGIDPSSDEPADSPPPSAGRPGGPEPANPPPANLPPASELSQKRWQQLLDRPRRPHTPGVWIVYFSLASLPIFGLGQLFIPATQTASRRYVFLLLCVYVGCGLALLLTTSFLSLRRYLRTRRLEMPAAMAGNWLVIGGIMVVALLLFSALLPRPAPEYAISALPQIGLPQNDSEEHDASTISAGSEGVRDAQAGSDSGVDHSPQPSADQPPDPSAGADTRQTQSGPGGQVAGESGSPSADKGSSGSSGKSAQQPGEKPQGSAGESRSSEQPSSNRPPSGEKSPSQPSDATGNNKSPQPAGKTDQQPGTQSQPQNAQPQKTQPQNSQPQNAQPPATPPPADRQPEPEKQPADKPPSEPGQKGSPPPPANNPAAANNPPPPSSPPTPPPATPPPATPQTPPLPSPTALLGPLAGLLKWAFYAALIAGVAYGAWRSREELRQIILGWLAALGELWRSLFGGQREISRSAGEIAFHEQQLGWSFSDFVDPFASGAAQNSAPAELVKYTFAALEVWGREQGFPREADATPHEFVALLGIKIPRLRADATALANLYARAVYSQGSLPPAAVGPLAQLWRLMRAAPAQQPALPE